MLVTPPSRESAPATAAALSVSAQFPMMVEMERDHGSLFRAMFSRRRTGRGPARLLSFDNGMSVLAEAMAAELGGSLMTGIGATAIEAAALDPGASGWTTGAGVGGCIRLVLATPARVTAPLLRGVDGGLAQLLNDIVSRGSQSSASATTPRTCLARSTGTAISSPAVKD